MRCRVYNCHYNDDGYCSQPDYVWIDKNGECDQMDVRDNNDANEEVEE